MADNIVLNAGTGGATLAADDIASVWYQRVKLTDGTADSATAIAAGGGVEAAALRVTLASDSTGLVSVDDNGASLTVDNAGTFAVQATCTNAGTFAVQATNAGTFATQVDGAALTALQLIDNPVATDGAAAVTGLFQVGGTDGTNAQILSTNTTGHLNIADGGNSITVDNGGTFAVQAVCTNAGTFAVQAVCTNAGTFAVQSTLQTGSALAGDVGISGARTSGGTTFHYNGGTNTLTQIKATAGQLYWLHVMNLSASVVYLQLFNKASASVTLGTTVADMIFPIPTQATTSGAGFVLSIPNGIAMGVGISYAITTTKGGSTAATADTAFLNAGYA